MGQRWRMATQKKLELELDFDLEPDFLMAFAALSFVMCLLCCFTLIMLRRNRVNGNSTISNGNCKYEDSDIASDSNANADNQSTTDEYDSEEDKYITWILGLGS